MTEMSIRAQALGVEVKCLKLELDGAVKTHDHATSSANKIARKEKCSNLALAY